MIYHCGPLIKDGVVISAGPTTSGRLTRYIDDVFSWGVTAMIGKGGLPGCADKLAGKAVYLAYPGGCGALAACRLTVVDAFMKDLGMAESIWKLQAFEFGPMIVAIDSHGNDLYEESKGRALREWV
jgi:fumarate hydratase subunit beta